MYNFYADPAVTNCTMSGNTASWGGAIYNHFTSRPAITNCILWGNLPGQVFDDSSVTVARYCAIQDGFPGPGNIDAHPMFVDPKNGDFRLQPGSPCIDAGHNNAIADLIHLDLDGNPRFADDPATVDSGCGDPVVVDLGAYEFQGDPDSVVFGDINGDGRVRISDLIALGACMGSADRECCVADLDVNGEVGTSDLALLISKLVLAAPLEP
jgi:hypothetical protein